VSELHAGDRALLPHKIGDGLPRLDMCVKINAGVHGEMRPMD